MNVLECSCCSSTILEVFKGLTPPTTDTRYVDRYPWTHIQTAPLKLLKWKCPKMEVAPNPPSSKLFWGLALLLNSSAGLWPTWSTRRRIPIRWKRSCCTFQARLPGHMKVQSLHEPYACYWKQWSHIAKNSRVVKGMSTKERAQYIGGHCDTYGIRHHWLAETFAHGITHEVRHWRSWVALLSRKGD